MTLLNIFLMASPDGKGSGMSSMFVMLAIFVIFYFFMIRPQVKRSKDQKKFRENIKKGDKVITIGGIHGKIAEVSDTTFIIETEGGNRLKIERTAVSMDAASMLGEKK